MGKITGFLDYSRELPSRRPVTQRVNDWFEIYADFHEPKLRDQASRCMDCGVPFCHTGCPVNNLIPDWNDLVYKGRWQEAVRQLHSTNNFPEFTGRVCPAPCEASCVLGINQPAVTIKQIEKNIVERGFAEGWIRPEPPIHSSGKRVAVVGSGPSGMAAAQQLRRSGHDVFLYEKADRFGGLLRYGIPHFKLESHILDRRLTQMLEEGVRFEPNVHVGNDVTLRKLRKEFDAVVLAGGSEQPRDLRVPGRELKGIHFAMEFLPQQNRRCLGDELDPETEILATGKNVVIIGGGDTGADCLGTCHRQKALSVKQFEIMPMPPEMRSPQDAVAAMADATSHRGRTRRGRNTRVECGDHIICWRFQRTCAAIAGNAGRLSSQVRTDSRHRLHNRCRPRLDCHGLQRPSSQRNDRGYWHRT